MACFAYCALTHPFQRSALRTAALQKAHQQQGKLAELPSPTITTHGYDSHV